MGSIWTVTPAVVDLELEFEGHPLKLTVKKSLTTGEDKKLTSMAFRRWSRGTGDDGEEIPEARIDWDAMAFQKVLTWVTGWDLKDEKDQPLKFNLDTLKALKPEVFKVIEEAVDKHADKKESAEKKS